AALEQRAVADGHARARRDQKLDGRRAGDERHALADAELAVVGDAQGTEDPYARPDACRLSQRHARTERVERAHGALRQDARKDPPSPSTATSAGAGAVSLGAHA